MSSSASDVWTLVVTIRNAERGLHDLRFRYESPDLLERQLTLLLAARGRSNWTARLMTERGETATIRGDAYRAHRVLYDCA
ncbi:MAG: hypothetical protein ABSD03_01340 [Vulcanimicrobiaceae bacterium]|jgi:hypothetical protein